MEFRTLKYFLTVAREENITRAAALLHLTQPTLSRQLMQLEEELGVKLFRRSQHHIVLTEAGMLLRRRAQEIVELAEKTARELRPAEEVTGRISIGSGDLRSRRIWQSSWLPFTASIPGSSMRFTAETPTGSRSGSSRDSWTWDFCWSRWTPAATRSSGCLSGNPGASWCRGFALAQQEV